jgi:lysophospholipase L1-like esterase
MVFVGVNDSKILAQFHEPLVPLDLFSRRLRMLVERLECAGVLVALCGLPDLHFDLVQENDSLKEFWYWIPEDYRRYNEEIRRIAQAGPSRVFVDLDAAFKASPEGLDDLFGPDGVHPSVTGHSVIAEALSASLVKLLETAGVDQDG